MSAAFNRSVRRPRPISEHGPLPAPIPNAVCVAIVTARDREPSGVTANVSRTARFAVRSASDGMLPNRSALAYSASGSSVRRHARMRPCGSGSPARAARKLVKRSSP
jgi:hypothetical protein